MKIKAWIKYHFWYNWKINFHYTALLMFAGKGNKDGIQWILEHCDELEKTDGKPPLNINGKYRKAVCRHELRRLVYLCKKSIPLMDELGY